MASVTCAAIADEVTAVGDVVVVNVAATVLFPGLIPAIPAIKSDNVTGGVAETIGASPVLSESVGDTSECDSGDGLLAPVGWVGVSMSARRAGGLVSPTGLNLPSGFSLCGVSRAPRTFRFPVSSHAQALPAGSMTGQARYLQ
jgi:hypothetical protein